MLSRERIEEIQDWAQSPDKYIRNRPGFRLPDPRELDELCRLALRATDPEYVLVPRGPSGAMLAFGADKLTGGSCAMNAMDFGQAYRAMLNAAEDQT